jgi:hypothetical protein
VAKLNKEDITANNISDYLKQNASFSFEMKVMKTLSELGYKSEHGGMYKDPITEKPRQFDIRSVRQYKFNDELGDFCIREVKLSVECKCLRKNYPLVVHCTKRKQEDAYHNLVYKSPEKDISTFNRFIKRRDGSHTISLTSSPPNRTRIPRST